MGSNIQYEGVKRFWDLVLGQNNSFIFIDEKRQVDFVKTSVFKQHSDFDVLDGTLGKVKRFPFIDETQMKLNVSQFRVRHVWILFGEQSSCSGTHFE